MKSHVGLGHYYCPVCLEVTDEVVLLDKRLKDTLEKDNFMGWEPCSVHEQQFNEGYIALIETTSNNPSQLNDKGRTGNFAMIRKEAFDQIFNIPTNSKVVFIDPEAFNQLQQIVANSK